MIQPKNTLIQPARECWVVSSKKISTCTVVRNGVHLFPVACKIYSCMPQELSQQQAAHGDWIFVAVFLDSNIIHKRGEMQPKVSLNML